MRFSIYQPNIELQELGYKSRRRQGQAGGRGKAALTQPQQSEAALLPKGILLLPPSLP